VLGNDEHLNQDPPILDPVEINRLCQLRYLCFFKQIDGLPVEQPKERAAKISDYYVLVDWVKKVLVLMRHERHLLALFRNEEEVGLLPTVRDRKHIQKAKENILFLQNIVTENELERKLDGHEQGLLSDPALNESTYYRRAFTSTMFQVEQADEDSAQEVTPSRALSTEM
jgi:hypothetical protein